MCNILPTPTDQFGQPLAKLDFITYPTRRGSSLNVRTAQVVDIGPDGDSIRVLPVSPYYGATRSPEVRYDLGRIVTLVNLDLVTKINPDVLPDEIYTTYYPVDPEGAGGEPDDLPELDDVELAVTEPARPTGTVSWIEIDTYTTSHPIPFKANDVIRAVLVEKGNPDENVTLGSTYVVQKVLHGDEFVSIIGDNGKIVERLHGRFDLVSPTFAEGDRVKVRANLTDEQFEKVSLCRTGCGVEPFIGAPATIQTIRKGHGMTEIYVRPDEVAYSLFFTADMLVRA